ncbi:DUF4913 domain-containing protein [Actinophytocola sp.]|uniref:DUF4913 domain-containing protein n=1 Tax=Actinophytocola sp. TaxID=1872138 RepID=UPI00389A2288
MTAFEELTAQISEAEQRITNLVADVTTIPDLADAITVLVEDFAEILTSVVSTVADLHSDLHSRHEQLARRIDALQADQFSMAEQVRLAANAANRAVVGLDELEDIVTELDERSGETAATFTAAMQQRDVALDDFLPPTAAAYSATAASPGEADTEEGKQERPALDVLYGWVAEHITPLVRRVTATGEGGGVRWCRQWWLHHDAIERFTALYLVFDELSKEDSISWLSAYLRDHLDPHLATLTSPYGPFYACSPQRHTDTANPLGHAVLDLADAVLDHAVSEPGPARSRITITGDLDDQVAGDTTGGTK